MDERATLTAVSCTSSNSMEAGFHGEKCSQLELTDCVSDEDGVGCSVAIGARLGATRVAVTRSTGCGYVVSHNAYAVLQGCSAKACGEHGLHCEEFDAVVHASGCTFESNGLCGVLAEHMVDVTVEKCTFQSNGECGVKAEGAAPEHALEHAFQHVRTRDTAEGTVKGCHSSQHSIAGYLAVGDASMKVSGSISEGDKAGCCASEGGQLTMGNVTVDGVLQTGQLPRRSKGGRASENE